MVRKLLLVCGILAALLYVGSDILAALRWEGYSYLNQSVSELRAIGAPTRPFLVPILTIYALLEIAFGVGVWMSAGAKRALRITGILLFALGVLDLTAYFFPMHLREEISQSGRTWNETMHVVVTGVTVLMILLIIGFGAVANGKWFRLYSYATILVLIVAGAWGGFGRAADRGQPADAVAGGEGAHQHLRLHAVVGDAGPRPLAYSGDRGHRQTARQHRSAPT